MSEKTVHKTVLLKETVDGLDLHDGSVIVDGTLGGGGHTKLICQRSPSSKVYAFDLDGDAIARSKEVLEGCNVEYIQSNFRNIKTELADREITEVDGIVLDLGFSSDQLEQAGRGISFQKDEPLVMTLSDKGDGVTAREIVNEWGEETIADIIYGFGEDRSARRIAKAIVEARLEASIETTFQLKEIVYQAVPFFRRKGKIHPATQTFQAIRIAVNEELEVLRDVLKDGFEILKPGGRMSIISFHSLEDRIVKKFFRDKEDSDLAKRITRKPIISGEEELKENRRARSAKLRILEKNK
jgi:16S rRNA (cytosine1402-N4)-methyltransferase